ncbi:MAG TPA: histidine phosphatase family protein [Desulfobacteraceae bacterium]|nr:histidine phosphatase family protein [Desulfobacteraceae bacterium]
MMTDIFLIRHAQASFGEADYDRLSGLGHRQAALLGSYLRRAAACFDVVFAGPLRRHVQTAEGVLKAAGSDEPLEIVDAFAEIDVEAVLTARLPVLLAAEPDLAAAYAQRYSDPRAYHRVVSRAMQISIGENEASVHTVAGFSQQVRDGLRQVATRSAGCRRVAVFTSGGPIAVSVQAALSLSPAVAIELGWQVYNTSVSVIETDGNGFSLKTFNAIGHLEIEADPNLKTLF